MQRFTKAELWRELHLYRVWNQDMCDRAVSAETVLYALVEELPLDYIFFMHNVLESGARFERAQNLVREWVAGHPKPAIQNLDVEAK